MCTVHICNGIAYGHNVHIWTSVTHSWIIHRNLHPCLGRIRPRLNVGRKICGSFNHKCWPWVNEMTESNLAHIDIQKSELRQVMLARTLTLWVKSVITRIFFPTGLMNIIYYSRLIKELSSGLLSLCDSPGATNMDRHAEEDNPLIFLAPLAAWAIISSVTWLQLVMVAAISFVRSWGRSVGDPQENHLNYWLASDF